MKEFAAAIGLVFVLTAMGYLGYKLYLMSYYGYNPFQ